MFVPRYVKLKTFSQAPRHDSNVQIHEQADYLQRTCELVHKTKWTINLWIEPMQLQLFSGEQLTDSMIRSESLCESWTGRSSELECVKSKQLLYFYWSKIDKEYIYWSDIC